LSTISREPSSVAQLLFSVDISLRWRDMDSYQHVNNSEYLTLCEESRIHWFHSLPGDWRSATAEPVVARIELDYRVPMHYPETVRAELHFERIGRSSLTLRHRLCSSIEPNKVYAEGKTVLVWTNPQTGSSTPVPDFIRNTLQGA
jgi:acyl-CoA thioester hydrolase